jgi:hypothetical protein
VPCEPFSLGTIDEFLRRELPDEDVARRVVAGFLKDFMGSLPLTWNRRLRKSAARALWNNGGHVIPRLGGGYEPLYPVGIEFHVGLCKQDDVHQALRDVFKHELAHVVEMHLHARAGHGANWREACRLLWPGQAVMRFHPYSL